MKVPASSVPFHYSYEQLADYSEGFLSKKMCDEIEAHLETCDVCASIVAGIRYSKQRMGEDRQEWEAWSDEVEARQHKIIEKGMGQMDRKEAPVSNFRTYGFMGIAASLILVAVLGGYFYFTSPDPLEVSGYLQVPYTSSGILRGSDALTDTWQQIKSYYDAGDYEQSGNRLDEVIEAHPENTKARFYRGLCYLYGDGSGHALAIPAFEYVLNHPDPFYAEQARWFLAIALYLNDDLPAARKHLTEITRQPDHYGHSEATKLLSH